MLLGSRKDKGEIEGYPGFNWWLPTFLMCYDWLTTLYNNNLLVNAIFDLILIVFYSIRSNMLPKNIAQYPVMIVRQSDAMREKNLACYGNKQDRIAS